MMDKVKLDTVLADTPLHPFVVTKALVLYFFNSDRYQQITELFGEDITDQYFQEKMDLYAGGLCRYFGAMDFPHQMKMIDLALKRYRGEAERILAANTSAGEF